MGVLLLIILLMLGVAVIVGATIILLATRMVTGFAPGFGNCVATAIVATLAGFVAHLILTHLLRGSYAGWLLSIVLAFLVNAFVINAMVKMPQGGQMGFGKAAIVSVLEYVIYVALWIVAFIVFGTALLGLFGAMSAH